MEHFEVFFLILLRVVSALGLKLSVSNVKTVVYPYKLGQNRQQFDDVGVAYYYNATSSRSQEIRCYASIFSLA